VILWIDGHSKVLDISGDERNLIAAGCFDVCLEHQAAIAALVERQLNGSALSLLRAAIEAFIRGIWVARCATDDEMQHFLRDQLGKGIRALVSDVEKALGNSNDVLSRTIKNQWGTLCSFTHTGVKQVTRRYTGPTLTPNYPDAELVQSLRFAGAVGLLAMMELATLSNNTPLALATLERSRKVATP
jgi:hypothetical protein